MNLTTYIIIGLLIFVIGLFEYRTTLIESLIEGKWYDIKEKHKLKLTRTTSKVNL